MSNEQQIKRIASREVQKIAKELHGVSSVVIATVDGFDIASIGLDEEDPGRIAAMASSVSAIGSVISQEESLGRSRSVTIATDTGFAYLSCAYLPDQTLILNVIADQDAVLGQVAYRCAESVRRLEAVA